MSDEMKALSKEDFLAAATVMPPEEIVEGCRVRALGASDYQRLQAMQSQAGIGAKAEDRFAAMAIAQTVGWLSMGVVEPKFRPAEWKAHLDRMNPAVVEAIVAAIKRLTGADTMEIELAKKLSSLTLGG